MPDMEQDRQLTIPDSKAVRLGITIAVFASLSLIALSTVSLVKGPDTADSFVPTNTGQYLSQRGGRPLTSLDFTQSTSAYEQAESRSNEYPTSTDGLFLTQQLGH